MSPRSTPPIPPLFWALLPFALGIYLGDATQAAPPSGWASWAPALPIALAITPLIALAAARCTPRPLPLVVILTLGLALGGLLRASTPSQGKVATWPKESQVWEGLVLNLEGPRADSSCVAVVALPPSPGERAALVRVSLDPCPQGLRPQGGLRFKGKPRPITNRDNPGERDRGPWARREGLSAIASGTMAAAIPLPSPNGPLDALIPLRTWASQAIRGGVAPEAVGIMEALIMGDKSSLDDGDRQAFAESGLAHALAISGLHVAGLGLLILTALRWLLQKLGRPGRRARAFISAIIALLCALAYATFAGLPISALRAWLMMLIALAIRLSERRSGALSALSLAAFIILLTHPEDLFNLGFQLSFVSVASLLLILPPLDAAVSALPWPRLPPHSRALKPLGWLLAYGRGSILVSTAATIGTAPLMALHFQGIPLAGPLANLLGLVLIGPITLPLGLLALLSHGLGLSAIGQALFALASLSAQGALYVARFFMDGGPLPFWRVGISPLEAALWGAVITSCLALARRSRLSPLPILGVLLCLSLGPRDHRSPPGALTYTQLAVGQGDGLYLRFPTGETLVVDGGGLPPWGRGLWDPGKAVMLPALLFDGVSRIDHMVLSHPDPDHIGGLVALAKALPVGTLWLADPTPGGYRDRLKPGLIPASPNDDIGALINAVRARGGDIRLALAGDRLRIGEVEGIVLHPHAGFDAKGPAPRKAANNGSLTWAFEAFGERILLPGDLEAYGEAALLSSGAPLDSAVLKLPHHGSDTSSTPPFLDAVKPRVAIVGVGRDNQFNFPRPSVLEALDARGVTLCRTDAGACRITLRPGSIQLEQWQTPRGWGPLTEPRPLWSTPEALPEEGPETTGPLAWARPQ